MKRVTIDGMSCGHCVAHVEKALKELIGVKSVEVVLEDNYALVDGEVSDQQIMEAIDDAGYEVIVIEKQ